MQTEIIIAGFGGQGILFAGQMLAYAGIANGQNVTWLPSYGPEMRGGTANVTVIIGDEEIGAPVVRHPQIALVFNPPSLEKFEPLVKAGGLLVYNSSMIEALPRRTDLTYIAIPANDIAQEIGNPTVANMVALGALVATSQILPLATVIQAMRDHLPPAKVALLKDNEQALHQGAALVEAIQAQ